MLRRRTIWVIVKIDEIEGGIVSWIKKRAKENIRMMKNRMIDSNMEMRCNTFMNINGNLRIVGRRRKTFPFWVDGHAKDLDPCRRVNVSYVPIRLALKLLKEKKIIWTIRKTIKECGDHNM